MSNAKWSSKVFSIATKARTGTSRWVIIFCDWIIVVSSLVIVGVIFSDICVRFVFGFSIMGTEEIALSAVLYLWFAAWIYATFTRTHICGTFPIRRRLAMDVWSIVKPSLCLILTLIFCYISYEYCAWVATHGLKTITFGIPVIYTVGVTFICLVITAGYLTWEIVGNARAIRHSRGKTNG